MNLETFAGVPMVRGQEMDPVTGMGNGLAAPQGKLVKEVKR